MVANPALAAIAEYTRAVERGEVKCTLERCLTCGRPGPLRYHCSRKRSFRVIVGRVVQRVRGVLTRWRCVACGKTVPVYPDFALRHKRYVRQDVFRLSDAYLSNDAASYDKTVRVDGMAICYDDADGGHILWPSTVHRWIGFLGGLQRTLGQVWQLVRAKSPTSDAFRNITPFPRSKCRSEHRKGLLQRCARLLRGDAECRNLFGTKSFTYLATACGWS